MDGLRLIELAALIRGFDSKRLADRYSPVFFLRQQRPSASLAAWEATAFARPIAKVDRVEASVNDYQVFTVRRASGEHISLGRAATNDVRIDDPSVSKFHALILVRGANFALADAGSKNGTYLNDLKVAHYSDGKAMTLKIGDRVRCGDVRVTFVSAETILELCSAV